MDLQHGIRRYTPGTSKRPNWRRTCSPTNLYRIAGRIRTNRFEADDGDHRPGHSPFDQLNCCRKPGPRTNDPGPLVLFNSLVRRASSLESQLRSAVIRSSASARRRIRRQTYQPLHTELILPDHHEAANAVESVAGSVMVTAELLVIRCCRRKGWSVLGYYAQSGDGRSQFEELDDALNHARQLSQEQALGAALRSGADNPQVVVTETADGLDTYRIQAKAVGNPRLAR
ncbi:MAG: hypothetical protein H6669_01610 [Ardenticatenaceae bacterium]|nr:hypothetical protein [Ardenticatenaceae bacterium]